MPQFLGAALWGSALAQLLVFLKRQQMQFLPIVLKVPGMLPKIFMQRAEGHSNWCGIMMQAE